MTLLWAVVLLITSETHAQDLENIGKQKPFAIHGEASLNLTGYGAKGIDPRQEPFAWVVSANATASIYGIDLPFSFTFSDRQYSYSQPFNQFGLSPRWKWITLHLGYRNVAFSDYTLAGKTFLGAGIELSPSIFRFGFVYGRFERKTENNPSMPGDSLPRYKNTGMAIRMGVGDDKNHVDLQVLKMKDDSSSLTQTSDATVRTPAENMVAGISLRLTLTRNLTLDAEAAYSVFTANQGADLLPEDQQGVTYKLFHPFMTFNQSTESYYAIKANLNYQIKWMKVKLEYQRLEPKYQSMGAYAFSNDIQKITLRPTFMAWKRKLVIGGSLGLQNDNLRKTKAATSMRTIGSLNVSLNPWPFFGIDAGYSNYGINQRTGRIPLPDSMRVRQLTSNITVTPRFTFNSASLSQTIMMVYNYMALTDKNPATSVLTGNKNQIVQLSYSASLPESNWTFSAGLNYLSSRNYMGSVSSYGLNAAIGKELLNQQLSLGLPVTLLRSQAEDAKGWILNTGLTADYTLTKHHSFKLNIDHTGNYFPTGSDQPSFNEIKGDLMYVYKF